MGRLAKKILQETDVLSRARERVRAAFDQFDTVAVSFSGGKDSTVVLNLTLEEAERRGKLPVHVFHFDEEAIPFETEAYVRRVAQDPRVEMYWLCLPVQHRNACSRTSPYWYPWAEEDKDKWVRPLPPEGITEWPGYDASVPDKRMTIPNLVGLLFPPEKYGNTGMMLGIRADESLPRTRSILSGRSRADLHIIPWTDGTAQGNLWKIYPIYDWRTEDVWLAPKMFNWDYNTSYDLMDMVGMKHNDQRCAPPYGEEPMRGLWTFAHCFPDIWDKMQSRVPGAATAARYSNTGLYSFGGGDMNKPEDMRWQEYIAFLLGKHNVKVRGFIAGRIKEDIQRHYAKTQDPILPKAPHPETGASWDFFYKIATRGDLKKRRFMEAAVNDQNREQRIRAYAAEYDKLKQTGELWRL